MDITPFSVYRTVAAYQMPFKDEFGQPLYISSFSNKEVSFKCKEVKPKLDKTAKLHGISVRSCAHENCIYLKNVSKHQWEKKDVVCISPQYFEVNAVVHTHDNGYPVEIEGVERDIHAYMCYELPKDTPLPDPFRLRVDNENNCTIFWDPESASSPPVMNECRIGTYPYFHSPALHALPWKVHCFKMEARAEPSDLAEASPSDPGIALVSVLLNYMCYIEEKNAHWLTLQTDNLVGLTSDCMTKEVREILAEIVNDTLGWMKYPDADDIIKFSDELDKILDERKSNRKSAVEVKFN